MATATLPGIGDRRGRADTFNAYVRGADRVAWPIIRVCYALRVCARFHVRINVMLVRAECSRYTCLARVCVRVR